MAFDPAEKRVRRFIEVFAVCVGNYKHFRIVAVYADGLNQFYQRVIHILSNICGCFPRFFRQQNGKFCLFKTSDRMSGATVQVADFSRLNNQFVPGFKVNPFADKVVNIF